MAKKSLCDECSGLCCRYLALPIETPRNKGDYDDIRWYLCHKDVEIFVEDGDWYIKIKNKCRYLSAKNHKCRMYGRKPRICNQYSHKECDLIEGEYDHKLHFINDKQVEKYIKVKFGDKRAKKRKKQRNSRSK